MATQRECCNYCMWYGPIKADGTMRKHYRASDEPGRRVQIKALGECPGGGKPFARFGAESEGTAPKESAPVKVKLSLSDETKAALRRQAAQARDEFRAKMAARQKAQRALYGV